MRVQVPPDIEGRRKEETQRRHIDVPRRMRVWSWLRMNTGRAYKTLQIESGTRGKLGVRGKREKERNGEWLGDKSRYGYDGRKVGTETPRVKKAREGVMERRLRNHPRDCPICDQGGECDLQDEAREYGGDRSRRREKKRGVEDKERGKVVKTVRTRCIHCTRCVRYVGEVGGKGELGRRGRGKEAEIGRYVEGKEVAEGRGGNRVDRCPVGARTGKEYEYKGRKWERKGRETVDRRDGVGGGRKRERRGGERKRVRPKREKERNGEWLGDKSRISPKKEKEVKG